MEDVPIGVKNCKKCKTDKPYSEYSRHKHYKDGFLNYCKECIIKKLKQKNEFNIEKYVSEPQFVFSLE